MSALNYKTTFESFDVDERGRESRVPIATHSTLDAARQHAHEHARATMMPVALWRVITDADGSTTHVAAGYVDVRRLAPVTLAVANDRRQAAWVLNKQ